MHSGRTRTAKAPQFTNLEAVRELGFEEALAEGGAVCVGEFDGVAQIGVEGAVGFVDGVERGFESSRIEGDDALHRGIIQGFS